jgi:hypothetical protein
MPAGKPNPISTPAGAIIATAVAPRNMIPLLAPTAIILGAHTVKLTI